MYCLKKRLKILHERLQRSGLPDALFFVVNVAPSFIRSADSAEEEIEEEAWVGVSPDEIERFSEIEKTIDSLTNSITPDIQLIQDSDYLGIWKKLKGSRDQVLVIDRYEFFEYSYISKISIYNQFN